MRRRVGALGETFGGGKSVRFFLGHVFLSINDSGFVGKFLDMSVGYGTVMIFRENPAANQSFDLSWWYFQTDSSSSTRGKKIRGSQI